MPAFNVGDIVGKTLTAATRVPIYSFPGDAETPMGYVNKGQPVGQVYSWLDADPSKGRSELWWVFYPLGLGVSNYYAPHRPGLYSIEALRDQGVLTDEEKRAAEEYANASWYEKLFINIGKWVPWIIGGSIVAAAAKGYLSRPPKSN